MPLSLKADVSLPAASSSVCAPAPRADRQTDRQAYTAQLSRTAQLAGATQPLSPPQHCSLGASTAQALALSLSHRGFTKAACLW